MSYTPTDEEQAFIRAYRRNVAIGTLSHLLYFLANKEDATEAVVDQIHSWSNIEDAWLMWRDAIEYTKETA
jgi:hypothetical protein